MAEYISILQVDQVFMTKAVKAFENTLKVLMKELDNYIQEDVYTYNATWTNGYDGEDGRTYGFLNTWINTPVVINGSTISSTIMQDGKSLIHDTWQHGNPWSDLSAESLAEIINKGLRASHFNFPAIESRPYWDDFLKYVNENYENILKQELVKLGVKVYG